MKTAGVILLVLGALLTFAAYFGMASTVPSTTEAGETIHNWDAAHHRLTSLILGCTLLLAGIILLGLDNLAQRLLAGTPVMMVRPKPTPLIPPLDR